MRKNLIIIGSIAILTLLLTTTACGFFGAWVEEAIEATRRYVIAKNYENLIKERIDIFKNIKEIILKNPPLHISEIRGVMNLFIEILQPLCVTGIIITGIYLIFLSGSPTGRAKAKNAFMMMIFAMALISVSPYILMLFFSFSHSITQNILTHAPENSEKYFTRTSEYLLNMAKDIIGSDSNPMETPMGVERPAMPFLLLSYLLLEVTILILKLRYFIVMVLASIFPLSILLYSFLSSRGIGRLLLEQTILWTLAQVAMALVFITVAIGISITDVIRTMDISDTIILAMEIAGIIILMFTPFVVARSFRGFLP